MLKRLFIVAKQLMADLKRPISPSEPSTALLPEKRQKLLKEHKFAMLLSYQGARYFGMQTQGRGDIAQPTIEGILLAAMAQANVITEKQRSSPSTFSFQRAARTDRAVSAVRQVCSMYLRLDITKTDEITASINAQLPEDIRLMGIKRVTKNFHCQKTCDSRTYSYTMPTFAFAPCDTLTTSSFRLSAEQRDEVNKLMDIYLGTHNFFNYTAQKEHGDRSCMRYILKFECGLPFTHRDVIRDGEMEFVTITIHGQSFMLHQIRKMMGMVIAVVRGFANKSAIQASWEEERLDIPKAPGLGLILERVHYDWYDKKYSKSHESLTNWPKCEDDIDRFKEEQIINQIVEKEMTTQSMMMWLADMGKHRFITDPFTGETAGTSLLGNAMHQVRAENMDHAIDGGDEEEEVEGNDDDDDKEEGEGETIKRSVDPLTDSSRNL